MVSATATEVEQRSGGSARTRPVAGGMRMALVGTDWGPCGVLWREEGDEEGEAFGGPRVAYLSRIVPPGLPEGRLRGLLRERAVATVAEVLPDSHGRFCTAGVPTWFGELEAFLQGYFSNGLRSEALGQYVDVWDQWEGHLDFSRLTAFQKKVLTLVARIPRGQVRTYGQIAQAAGNPNGARAVGMVMRTNPWPVLIPCHRVVGAKGALTGFSAPGGVCMKKRMLELEGA